MILNNWYENDKHCGMQAAHLFKNSKQSVWSIAQKFLKNSSPARSDFFSDGFKSPNTNEKEIASAQRFSGSKVKKKDTVLGSGINKHKKTLTEKRKKNMETEINRIFIKYLTRQRERKILEEFSSRRYFVHTHARLTQKIVRAEHVHWARG